RVGFDLDGVLLYNPARIARPIVSFIKRSFFKKKDLKFYSPHTYWQKQLWRLFHKSSIFIAPGLDEIKKLIREKKIKAYIVTARYSYLKNDLEKWLINMKIDKYFSGIFYNQKDEQPHIFKKRVIEKLNLDIFVEDNWDIVNYLNLKNSQLSRKRSPKIKIFWIYNIFDRNQDFLNKFPNLKSVVKIIERNIL
ncbi:MAG: hypothetical protein WCT34_05485, partial [Patescibacteria group bacterium]